MAEAYRGLTIRFSADAKSVLSTMRSMTKAAANVNSELSLVQRALRLNPSSQEAARKQVQLLGEQARLAQARAQAMRSEFNRMGNIKINGEPMRELSARTKDAATQASFAREQYNSLVERLAIVKKRMAELNRGETTAENIAELNRLEAEYKRLSSTLDQVSTRYKNLNDIAGYQSWGNKAMEEAAKAKAAIKDMVNSSMAARPTAFTEGIERARIEVQELAATGSRLKEAMHIDPSNVELASSYFRSLREQIAQSEQQSKLLKAEIRSLSGDAQVRKMASDFEYLKQMEETARVGLERCATEMSELGAKASTARNTIAQLETKLAELNASGKSSKGVAAGIEKLNAEANKAESELAQVTRQYRTFETLAQKTTAANGLRAAQTEALSLESSVAAATASMTTMHKSSIVSMSALKSLGMTAFNTITPAAMMLGHYAIQSAKDIDGAYRNMRKTVNGTEEDFEHLKQAALEFGDAHFTSADDILQIEALGGQLGIAVQDLEKFAETVSNIDIATDLDSETAALKLGQLSNILKLTKDDWEGFSDALVRLGNNSPTLESSIMEVMSRISPMGAIVKMNADELLGWSTAVASTGQKAEAAGTAVARTMSQIEQAVAVGSGAFDVFTEAAGMSYDAWMELFNAGEHEAAADVIAQAINSSSDALEIFAATCETTAEEFAEDFANDPIAVTEGLADAINEGTGKLEDFAEVAGMTASQFAKLWEEDPSQAMYEFIEGLKEIDENGGSVDKTLGDLKINAVRQKQALEGLTTTYDVLTDALKMSDDAFHGVGDEFGDAGDAAREAARKAEGFSGLLQQIFNNGQHLASIMGESLTPTLEFLLGVVQRLTSSFEGMDSGTQQLLTLTALSGALSGPVLTGVSSLATAFADVRASLVDFASAEAMVARASKTNRGIVGALSAGYVRASGDLAAYNSLQREAGLTTAQANAQIGKSKAVLQATSTGYKVATVAAQAFNAAASMAAVALAAIVVSKVVSYFADLKAHEEDVTRATDGLHNALVSVKQLNIDWSAQGSLDKATSDMQKYKVSVDEAKQSLDNAIQSNIDLATYINGGMETLVGKEQAIDRLRDAWEAYGDGSQATEEQLAELKVAVDEVNNATGANLSLVTNSAGGYELLTEATINARDRVADLADEFEGRDLGEDELASLQASVAEVNEEFGTTYTVAQSAEGGYKIVEEGANSAADAVSKLLQQMEMQNKYSAFGDMAREAQQNLIQATQAYSNSQSVLADKTEDLRAHIAASLDATDEMKNYLEGLSLDELIELDPIAAFTMGITDAKQAAEESLAVYDEAKEVSEAYAGAQQLLAAASEETASGMVRAIASNDALITSLVACGDNAMDFSSMMDYLGVSAEDMANITVTQASELANAFGNSMTDTIAALDGMGVAMDENTVKTISDLQDMGANVDVLNAMGIDPKEVIIHAAEGTFEDAYGNIWDFNNEKINDKDYTVNDDNTISVEGSKIDKLKGKLETVPKTSETRFYENGAAAVTQAANNVSAAVRNADGQTATVTFVTRQITQQIKEVINKGGNASGGVIPGHMAGGILSGNIVASPTLTNYGWVGEAGAEAIIPLTNRHYVRPFAEAVASEMGGSQVVNNYNYSIGGLTYEPDSRVAGLIGQVFDVAFQESRM